MYIETTKHWNKLAVVSFFYRNVDLRECFSDSFKLLRMAFLNGYEISIFFQTGFLRFCTKDKVEFCCVHNKYNVIPRVIQ